MVGPKASQADENLSMLCCISGSEDAFNAQSSAKSRSLTQSILTLDLVLKSPQIKQFAVCPESYGDSVTVVSEGFSQHG